jgi:hypothetical protein
MWQNTYSQLLYQDDKKGEYLSPYEPSVSTISPNVEKWVNEQIANKDGNKKTIKMKTDLLGRVKSSSDVIGQEKVVENEQKRLVVVSDMHIRENKIEIENGRYEYNMETKKYDYFLNGKKMSEKEYLEYQGRNFEKFKQQKRGKRDLHIPGMISGIDDRAWVAWMTAAEILELVKNYKELTIYDYEKPKSGASQASILSSIQLSTHAFPNSYKGNGIGVYVTEVACAILSGITTLNKYTVGNPCLNPIVNSDNAHHTMVANVVQMASPLAHVVGFDWNQNGYILNPSNPFSYPTPLEIGSHSCGWTNGYLYGTQDRDMDNYIYENKVTNFVLAHNKSYSSDNFYVASPGKAMNAITIGAVEPATNRYASYSRWINPTLMNRNGNLEERMGSDKPEIAMYTDIEFPGNSVMQAYYPYHYNGFNGTSAATPLAAGFTATLLDQHPFFKRQPALMKAVLLTGETIPINYASSWDTDNGTNDFSGYNASVVARGITNYSSVAWGTRSAWWSGNNSSHFDSNREIKFTENNIQANKRYRIAIAYLVSGTYVYNNGKLPQDIDLHVEQNGQTIAFSISARNPFEVVDFVTKSNAPLTIKIFRISNSGNGDLLLGYHMRENF